MLTLEPDLTVSEISEKLAVSQATVRRHPEVLRDRYLPSKLDVRVLGLSGTGAIPGVVADAP